MIFAGKTGTGLMLKDSDLVLGKKLKVDILKDTLIKLEFLNRHIIQFFNN